MAWLATIHYAKSTLKVFDDMGIRYVDKSINPPKVPQLRPIEHFWSILKNEVYADGWEATNKEMLIAKINKCISSLDFSVIQAMMKNVKSKIKEACNSV